MQTKQALYKKNKLLGYFNTVQEIFFYIKKTENIDLHCTCQLELYGYEMKEI